MGYITDFVRVLISLLIALISLMIFGCSAKPEKIIYVPQKCEVDDIFKPPIIENKLLMNLNILQYCEQLEEVLRRCK